MTFSAIELLLNHLY